MEVSEWTQRLLYMWHPESPSERGLSALVVRRWVGSFLLWGVCYSTNKNSGPIEMASVIFQSSLLVLGTLIAI